MTHLPLVLCLPLGNSYRSLIRSCHGDSVNQGTSTVYSNERTPVRLVVYGPGYQDEEQKVVEERTRLYTQRQALSEPLTRLPCPCSCSKTVFRYGTVTFVWQKRLFVLGALGAPAWVSMLQAPWLA